MSNSITVGDVIAFLMSENVRASDDIVVSRGKLYVGRGCVVVGEIDFERCTTTFGVGLLTESGNELDECEGRYS